MKRDVALKCETGGGLSLGEYQASLIHDRIAGDTDLLHTIEQLQEVSLTPRVPEARKQIVVDVYAARRLTGGTVVVPAQDVDPTADAAHNVVPESDVLHHSPGHGPAFVAHGEEHRKSVLAMGPVVLHEIAFHQHPAGVLKLEDILHVPG